MNNRCCFEALDRSLRDVLTNGNDLPNDKPFGGKSILLGGDFRQILPVIPGGTKEDIVHASLCNSVLWSKFKVLTLTKNMRLSSNGLSNDKKKKNLLFLPAGFLQLVMELNKMLYSQMIMMHPWLKYRKIFWLKLDLTSY